MARTLAKAVSPISVRLTAVERANLQARAGTLTLSAYVKKALFDDTPAVAKMPSSTLADRTLLAHLLATLGGSDLAASLYRLARAADNGSLLADEETTRRIQLACDDVRLMHNALMRGLGKEVRAPSQRELHAADQFRAAADKGGNVQ